MATPADSWPFGWRAIAAVLLLCVVAVVPSAWLPGWHAYAGLTLALALSGPSSSIAVGGEFTGGGVTPGGPGSLPVFLPWVNVLNFGARDGTDSTGAFEAALLQAAIAKSAVYCPAGTYTISAALTFTAGARTVLFGDGPNMTVLKGAGANALLNVTQSHQVGEWGTAVYGMTIDGGGAATTAATFSRCSRLVLRDLIITNNTGTCLELVSLFDSDVFSVFVSSQNGVIGTTAEAVVVDTTLNANDQFDHNLFYDLHIEGSLNTLFSPLRFIGNATNNIRYNQFFGLKVHGNPNTGDPNAPLVDLSFRVVDNMFYGVKLAAGRGFAQFQIAGLRNLVDGMEADCTVAPNNATAMVQFLNGATDNVVRALDCQQNSHYATAVAIFDAGSLRNRLLDPIYQPPVAVQLVSNSGTGNVATNREGSSGDRGDASITATPGDDFTTQRFDTALSVNRTVTVPNAATLKNWPGARFRIVRTGAGAGTLTVQDSTPTALKVVAAAGWVDVEYNDASGWREVAAGAL